MLKLLVVLLLSFSHAVFAGDEIDSGHTTSFQTLSSTPIANDVMRVMMNVEIEGKNASVITNKINKKVAQIKDVLADAYVEFKTTSYNVSPRYYKSKIKNWYGVYSFNVESKDFELLSNVLTTLQQFANYKSVHFFVSNEMKDKMYNQLLESAIKKHRKRAEIIASSFGYKTVKFNSTSFNRASVVSPPRRYASKMMAEDSMAAPSFSAGKSSIDITINSTITLE